MCQNFAQFEPRRAPDSVLIFFQSAVNVTLYTNINNYKTMGKNSGKKFIDSFSIMSIELHPFTKKTGTIQF